MLPAFVLLVLDALVDALFVFLEFFLVVLPERTPLLPLELPFALLLFLVVLFPFELLPLFFVEVAP